MSRWADVSISRKLYFVIGGMAVLLAAELATLRFAMHTLSAVRAFVGGEGSWSKAQKNAAIALERYALSRDEADYRAFLSFLELPGGDHRARIALMQANPDMVVVRNGFLAGQIHGDDIDAMVELLERFSTVSYLAQAIQAWTDADNLLDQFRRAGADYHSLVSAGVHDAPRELAALRHIEELNTALTQVEDNFSRVLGAGSRWMEGVLIRLLMLAVLTVETVGLTLTFVTTRRLSRGLATVQRAAARIGEGEFEHRITITSRDEVGLVGESINRMGALLEKSYTNLEQRVRERTAELERLVAENARLYEQAAEAVKMRDEFFSIASHELRSPMTALHLQIYLLARSVDGLPESEQRTKATGIIQSCIRQTTRLSQLSSELLDLTRIRLGKLELGREFCDLTAITRDAMTELASEAARSGSEIRLEAAAPVRGEWDPTRLGQVVRNLLSNAIKYGDGRPIELDVTSAESVARLCVRDHGHGIAPQDQRRIFERYERAELNASIVGLGLGLYVSQQIVQAHAGTLSVQSLPGEGSTFTLELPLPKA